MSNMNLKKYTVTINNNKVFYTQASLGGLQMKATRILKGKQHRGRYVERKRKVTNKSKRQHNEANIFY
jgi:hypothetical protein